MEKYALLLHNTPHLQGSLGGIVICHTSFFFLGLLGLQQCGCKCGK